MPRYIPQKKVAFVGKAPDAVLDEVLSLLDACLYHPT